MALVLPLIQSVRSIFALQQSDFASCGRSDQRPFEIAAPPAHFDDRAALRELAVFQRELGPRPRSRAKVDRVLQEIAEAVEDRRIARHARLSVKWLLNVFNLCG